MLDRLHNRYATGIFLIILFFHIEEAGGIWGVSQARRTPSHRKKRKRPIPINLEVYNNHKMRGIYCINKRISFKSTQKNKKYKKGKQWRRTMEKTKFVFYFKNGTILHHTMEIPWTNEEERKKATEQMLEIIQIIRESFVSDRNAEVSLETLCVRVSELIAFEVKPVEE